MAPTPVMPQTTTSSRQDGFAKYGLWIAAVLCLVYLGLAALRPLNTFWSIDGGGKFIYLVSTLQTGDALAPLVYPQRSLDPLAQFAPLFYRIIKGSQFYTWWSPFLPLASIPFYLLLGNIGLYLLPALSGAACAWFSGKIAHLLSQSSRAAWLALAAVGLTTPVTFYSQMFWEHTPSVALLLAALFLLLKYFDAGRVGWMLLAGAVASFSASFRPEIAVICFCFGVVLLVRNWRKAFFYALGFVLAAIPWVAFTYLQSGSLLYPSMGLIVGDSSFSLIGESGFLRFFSRLLLNSPERYGFPISRFNQALAAVGMLLMATAPISRRIHWVVIPGSLALGWVSLQLLAEPTGYQAVHGFLTIAPGVLLAVWFFRRGLRGQRALFAWMLAASVAGIGIVYILKSWEAAGGLQWGPRYLLAFYPLLWVAGVVGLTDRWSSINRTLKLSLGVITLIFALLGTGFQVRGMMVVYQSARYADASAAALRPYEGKPLLLECDVNTLVPELYFSKPVFDILRSDLKSWNNHLASLKVASYYQVNFDLCSLERLDEIKTYRQSNPSGVVIKTCDVRSYLNQDKNPCTQIHP